MSVINTKCQQLTQTATKLWPPSKWRHFHIQYKYVCNLFYISECMQISKTAEPQRKTSPRDLHIVFERQELFLQKRRRKKVR